VAAPVDNFFRVTERGSTFWTEFSGGMTTFFSMCYIMVLNGVIMGGYFNSGSACPLRLCAAWPSAALLTPRASSRQFPPRAFSSPLPSPPASSLSVRPACVHLVPPVCTSFAPSLADPLG
jgi:hypothetical protein